MKGKRVSIKGKRVSILILAAAVTLSGCLPLKFLPDSISGQQISRSWVQLDFGVCAFSPQGTGGGSCLGSAPQEPVSPALIAIRAHKDTGMPFEISSVSGTPITLTRNQSYTQSLNEWAPHGTHRRWFGYRSTSQAQQQITDTYFEVQMQVPRGFARDEFGVTPAAGTSGSAGVAADIECGPDVFASRCITDPSSNEGLQNIKIPLTDEG